MKKYDEEIGLFRKVIFQYFLWSNAYWAIQIGKWFRCLVEHKVVNDEQYVDDLISNGFETVSSKHLV